MRKEGGSHESGTGGQEKRTTRTDHEGRGSRHRITIMLGQRAEEPGGGDTGRTEEEMGDATVEEAEEEDITMGGSATVTTTAVVMITVTIIEREVETGAPAAANV